MRVAVMLRALNEKGGVGVYTRNLVDELLRLEERHEYVFLYQRQSDIGRYAGHENVIERWLGGRNKAIWDQIRVPIAVRRDRADVLLHPKFTAPLLAPCPTVMVVHGADWLMPDQAQFYEPLDVAYMRIFLPLYFRKCARVISVSQLTTDNFLKVLPAARNKIITNYFGPARHFRRVEDPKAVAATLDRYSLPPRFIFTLSKRGGGSRKNLRNLLEGYGIYHDTTTDPLPLVLGGKECERYLDEYDLRKHPWSRDVHCPGWIDQRDLPAVYTRATLYLYPSNLEAFPIPLTEAMSCGTPIVTSNVNGLREIAGDAALLVDPSHPEAIADGLRRVTNEEDLRRRLAAAALERARRFSWETHARDTLDILERAIQDSQR